MAVELKTETTAFNLSKRDKDRLKKVCESKGVRMSDYIRDLVLKQVNRDER